jgi:hypothetical protein
LQHSSQLNTPAPTGVTRGGGGQNFTSLWIFCLTSHTTCGILRDVQPHRLDRSVSRSGNLLTAPVPISAIEASAGRVEHSWLDSRDAVVLTGGSSDPKVVGGHNASEVWRVLVWRFPGGTDPSRGL